MQNASDCERFGDKYSLFLCVDGLHSLLKGGGNICISGEIVETAIKPGENIVIIIEMVQFRLTFIVGGDRMIPS